MKKTLLLVSLCLMSVICFGKQQATTKPEVTDPTVVDAPAVDRMQPKFKFFEEKAYGEIEEYTIYFLTQPEGFKNLGKDLYIKGRLEADEITPESKVWVFIHHHHPICPCPNSWHCPCQKDKETR